MTNRVIVTRLESGKVLTSESSATTRASTVRWLRFAAKWRNPANPQSRDTVSFKALFQAQTRDSMTGKEVQNIDNSH